MQPSRMRYVWSISLIAALGGLLFGYDWVVIGGAKPFYEKYFHLTSAFQSGWANSCALVGCLIGSLISGGLSDKYGRKRLLILAGMLFVATGIGVATAESFPAFVFFRILGGMGIGLASNISPMYIAEVSPAEIRGKLVSLNQLTIVIGILVAQVVNWLIAEPVPPAATAEQILHSWNGQVGWRWMFGSVTVPGALFFLAMFAVPESPRWLVKSAKHEKARVILRRIGGSDYANAELVEITKTLLHETEQVRFRELLDRRMLGILLLGVTLAVFQQWCGINVIFNYAEEVFRAAGYGVDDILRNIVITGSVNLAFTLVAIVTVDRLGRRTLLLAGAGGLALLYGILGAGYHFHSQGLHMLLLVVLAIACYACTLAPVVWVVLAEIFPNRIRGAAMSVSVFALWAACFVLTYTFPILNRGLGPAATFWSFGAICLLGFGFIYCRLPETKGKSLERIERELVG